MKEIKDFIQELCECAKPSINGSIWFHHPGGWDGIIQIASVVRNKSI